MAKPKRSKIPSAKARYHSNSVQNPYQQSQFPDVRRLSFLSLVLGAPTIWILLKDHSNAFLFNSSLTAPFGGRSHSSTANNIAHVGDNDVSRSLYPRATPSSFEQSADPNLKEMKFRMPGAADITESGDENQSDNLHTFDAYVEPDVSTFYQEEPGSRTAETPWFRGLAGKFINLSPDHLHLYWDDGRDGLYIADMRPFEAVGTATFPDHKFFIAHSSDSKKVVERIHVQEGKSLYVYDKFAKGLAHVQDLSEDHLELYKIHTKNLEFAKAYKEFTGRDWLSLYPHRSKPMYNMWPADYFGQQHWVTTRETHFITEPPEELLGHLSNNEMHRDRTINHDHRQLDQYRSSKEDDMMLNMTLTVLSVAPRVYEIQNFLSHVEVDHIVHMATGMKLSLSTTSGSDGHDRRKDERTRTSRNSWVNRNRSPIMDSIYARAADLMRIDEALLRHRGKGENQWLGLDVGHTKSNAEEFQLVHYDVTEQYTAHHDFSYPSVHLEGQPARFATLLLYLNEGMDGGETTFPRWRNAHSKEKLKVKPEIGKAILFYDQLPDGNMDDLSQHAAEPVRGGEKWLINLWTWDPSFR